MKLQHPSRSGSGQTRWYIRAGCVVLCLLMALALTTIPISGNTASAYTKKEDPINRFITLQMKQVYPKIKIVAKAFLVGEDKALQKGSKVHIQKVPAGTKIQGQTIDPKYMPQDNMEVLKNLYSSVVSGTPLSFPNCAFLEREGTTFDVVYYDAETVIFWSPGYRSFSMSSIVSCNQSVLLESHSPGFYQISRKYVWLDTGRNNQYNVIPSSELKKEAAATGTVGSLALPVRSFPMVDKKYDAAYMLDSNTQIEVMSTEPIRAIDGSSDTYYKIRFNQTWDDDSYYMRYKNPGYYYVNTDYVDLNIKGKTAPAATTVGRTENIKYGNYIKVRSSPKNITSNIIGKLMDNVEVTQIPSKSITDPNGKQWKALWYSGQVAYVPANYIADGGKIVIPKKIQNIRVKDVKNGQYVITWDDVPKLVNYQVVVSNTESSKLLGTDWVVWKSDNYKQNTLTVKKDWFKKATNGNLYVMISARTQKQAVNTSYITIGKLFANVKPEKIKDWQIVEEGKGKLTFMYMSSVQYSTNKNFKNAKTINFKTMAGGENIKGFKKNTTYYFRYRFAETVKTESGKVKVYSPWSDTYKKKITWKPTY